MKINIKKVKIWKIGYTYVATIPIAFIRNGQIDPTLKYELELKEVSE